MVITAALCTWIYTINHEILFWPEHYQQALGGFGLAATLLGLCVFAFLRGWERRLSQLAVAVLALFILGEFHRHWLRHEYRAHTAAPARSWQPITTLDLQLRHYDLPLAAVARLRILHITDLHITEALPFAYYERLSADIRARNPDAIVFTGDLLSRRERLPLLEKWLTIVPAAPLGTYAVLGNHEYWAHAADEVRNALEHARIAVIAGRCLQLPGRNLRICGTEAPWGPKLDVNAVTNSSLPFVALSHTPDNIYDLAALGAVAVLAGHTHGGQLRLPWFGPIVVPSRFGRRFDAGQFQVGRTHLFVSQGVGADSPPLRMFCAPELLELEITQ